MATNFSRMINGPSGNNLMVVDAMNLAFRWKHQGRLDFKEEYLRTVESLARSYDCSKIVIAADLGSSTYRKALYPEYKQNRKDKVEQQTPEEKEAFEKFFEEFQRTMEYIDKYPVLRYRGVEADDIAGYIAKNAKNYDVSHIWLISSDKDWDLLISDRVSRFSYVTRKEITKDNWSEHYDYDVDDHISIKCLTGDSGDNIPGVPGIGPTYAKRLVLEFGSTYDIISSIPIASKYKYIANLNDFGVQNLLRNYQLMDLITYCEEAIGKENCEVIDKTLKEYLND